MWTAPGEIVVDRERHTVQSPKFILTVVWNSIGFHVLKTLPYSGYSGGNPAGDLERSFSRMDGAIAKMRTGRW
jgi:hypothetical protein